MINARARCDSFSRKLCGKMKSDQGSLSTYSLGTRDETLTASRHVRDGRRVREAPARECSVTVASVDRAGRERQTYREKGVFEKK